MKNLMKTGWMVSLVPRKRGTRASSLCTRRKASACRDRIEASVCRRVGSSRLSSVTQELKAVQRRDAVQPRQRGRFAPEIACVRHRLQKDILNGVMGSVVGSKQGSAPAKDRRAMAVEESRDRTESIHTRYQRLDPSASTLGKPPAKNDGGNVESSDLRRACPQQAPRAPLRRQ